MLDEIVMKFLNSNNVSNDELARIDGTIYCPKEIDSLIDTYKLSGESQKAIISISDIVGYNYHFTNTIISNNIFDTFVNFFGGKDGYHSRADSMLEITTNDPIETLSKSFEIEEIIIDEATNNKYVISSNGLHRYTILRSLYLIELSRTSDEMEINRINKKYQIPVIVNKIDYLKTYCRCILSKLGIINKCMLEIDKNYNYTGNVNLEMATGEIMILTNEELKQLTLDSLDNYKENIFQVLSDEIDNNEGFREFLSKFYPMDTRLDEFKRR